MEHYDVVVKCTNIYVNAMIMSKAPCSSLLDIMMHAVHAHFVSRKTCIVFS